MTASQSYCVPSPVLRAGQFNQALLDHSCRAPKSGTNGFDNFSKYIAPHIRRTLLLTATPFQLRPDEMLEILKVSDFMQSCPTKADSLARCERLREYRQDVLLPALQDSEKQSRNFSRAWVRIPPRVRAETLADSWDSPEVKSARESLRSPAETYSLGGPHVEDIAKIITAAISGTEADIRQFLKEALYLDAYNARLSRELGKFVIRHRRQTDHRFFRIGTEYGLAAQKPPSRPDSHILHPAPGLDIRGEAELPQFLLMRCVSEMKNGKGRSSLGSDLTGCYSTLHESAEGRRVKESLKESLTGRLYLELLFGMVNRRHDHKHPKLSCVVDEVIEHWKSGEKVLIFCFRVNTAERLRDIITDRIRNELKARKLKCLGGEAQLKTLRARLTGRDRDLVVLGLDRMLWSYAWACRSRFPVDPQRFILEDEELPELARLSLQFGVDLTGERVDRVFLNRATEHLLARRFLKLDLADADLRQLLKDMAQVEWIAEPYALQYSGDEEDPSEEISSFDERGCHTKYTALDHVPDQAAIQERADALRSTRQRARIQKQIPLLDSYALAPSLWLGDEPQRVWHEPDDTRSVAATLLMLHDYLWQLTDPTKVESSAISSGKIGYDYGTRGLVFQALRRALLRESVLLRLLPQRSDLDESGWGELLARSFLANLPNQHESMAHRVAVFLEDLKAASGDIAVPSSARGALYEATRLRDQQFVALVKGGGGNAITTRDRIFNGFNTPLLPEVLICTQVGQEGIDLHRHCRHVVHYDLAWNPAVLEQRTGRADRIGSKTFRERDAASDPKAVCLQIGVPFIAGTYDERMYEELRLRAQTFEVLTGGDFAADHSDGLDDTSGAEGKELGLSVLPLPPQMISDLRVKLHVWTAPEPPHQDYVSASSAAAVK
jgi:Helicase conserved C-terminal domain